MLTSCDVIYRWQKIRNHNFHQSIQRLYRNSHNNKTNRISSTASSIFPPSICISFHRIADLLHSKFTYTAADSSYLLRTVPLVTLDINKSSTITLIWFLVYNVFFFSEPMLPHFYFEIARSFVYVTVLNHLVKLPNVHIKTTWK